MIRYLQKLDAIKNTMSAKKSPNTMLIRVL